MCIGKRNYNFAKLISIKIGQLENPLSLQLYSGSGGQKLGLPWKWKASPKVESPSKRYLVVNFSDLCAFWGNASFQHKSTSWNIPIFLRAYTYLTAHLGEIPIFDNKTASFSPQIWLSLLSKFWNMILDENSSVFCLVLLHMPEKIWMKKMCVLPVLRLLTKVSLWFTVKKSFILVTTVTKPPMVKRFLRNTKLFTPLYDCLVNNAKSPLKGRKD